MNLLFHPERTNFVAVPLDVLLKEATGKRDVWVTTLDDIARWWQERATFSFEINPVFAKSAVRSPQSSITYKVTAHCNSRATVAVQHPGGKMQFIELGENGTFSVHSKFRPVIAVSSGFCNEELQCLINDGFVVEHDADPSQCAFVLDGTCAKNKRLLLEVVKKARGPLLRFRRWPNRFRSALAVSADVDAITLTDFVRRACHFVHTKNA